MGGINVIFTLDGRDLTIQCTKDDKMGDICQKYANKIEKKLNSLIFIYGGNQLNFNLRLEEQANSIDKERKEMNILVYQGEIEKFFCPKCGETIYLNIEEMIKFNNELIDSITGIKSQLENIINNPSIKNINSQIKNVNKLLMSINEDINKNIEKIQNIAPKPKMNNGNTNNDDYSKVQNETDKNKIRYLERKIISLEKELNAYKSCIPFEIGEGEKIMSVTFCAPSGYINHYPIICKKNQIFNTLENKLYEAFPRFKERNAIFIFNGTVVNKSKTLNENGINDKDTIILLEPDDE